MSQENSVFIVSSLFALDVMPLLFTATRQRNSDILDACATASLPFLHNSFGVAFKGLAEVFRLVLCIYIDGQSQVTIRPLAIDEGVF